ncbi:hypothetical protein WK58_09690 [Burkholderia ubonensis]|uniref:hypothetical protein n=1 Tax=Burkholderia ubonensis TaxID=101571 RepID=UPI000752A25A|nr:hypothetical protein [Burkholderia ubonensis]KVT77918.1 hypothetical protein WK58_09690 [Burkholderia ubonensis]
MNATSTGAQEFTLAALAASCSADKAAIAQQLRDELRAAHTIIRNALGVMTFDQKLQWANANERDDAIGEGVTRANERQAVIDDGSPRALFLELRRADLIIANAWEIQSFHQHALWTTANLQDGVAARHPTRADSRTLVLAAAVDAARELVGDARGSIADAIVGYVKSIGDVAPAESSAWCGIDAGDPAGDQAALVLKPTCELSEADIAEFRRAFHATARTGFVTLHVEQPTAALTEEMIRFCPECGCLGDIAAGYEACCPDSSSARIVPKRFAELCAETFRLCVSQPYPLSAVAPADERAAFERYVILSTDQSIERDSRGEYVSQLTREWWRVWQARAAASPAAEPVRTDVTYDDVVSACDAHGITLPVEAIDAAVALINHFAASQPAQVDAPADAGVRPHIPQPQPTVRG